MALLDNIPNMGFIYIQNLVITYDNKAYVINNIYTDKKYIYWDLSNPSNLFCTDTRQIKENLFFIIKNNSGNAIRINPEEITLTFDGYNSKVITKKIQLLNNKNEAYQQKLTEITTKTQELSDEYKQDKSFSEIKEELNTLIINYNSQLITLNNTLDTYVEDNKLIDSEKTDINVKTTDIETQSTRVLACADALADLVCAEDNIDKDEDGIIAVSQYRTVLEQLVAQLVTNINDLVLSENEDVTPSDISIVSICIDDMLNSLSNLKDSCNSLLFLGSGGTISDEVYNITVRLNNTIEKLNELQESVLNDSDNEKQDVHYYFNSIKSTINKIITITNEIRRNSGVVTNAQYSSLRSYNVNLKEYTDKVTGIYQSYYSNKNTTETIKKDLKVAYENFIARYNDFADVIINRLKDLELDSSDGNRLTYTLTEFRSACNVLDSKLVSCINQISNTTNETALKQIKEDLQKQVDDLKTEYESLNKKYETLNNNYTTLSNEYKALAERVSKLES